MRGGEGERGTQLSDDVLLGSARQEAGDVNQGHDRDVKSVAEPNKPSSFHRRINVKATRCYLWLVCNDSDRPSSHPGKADDNIPATSSVSGLHSDRTQKRCQKHKI